MNDATALLAEALAHLARGDTEAAAASLARLAPMIDGAKWPRTFDDGRGRPRNQKGDEPW